VTITITIFPWNENRWAMIAWLAGAQPAFNYAARYGSKLNSSTPIKINAVGRAWDSHPRHSATESFHRDFAGAPVASTCILRRWLMRLPD